MLSPKLNRKNQQQQQQYINDPYNSNLNLNQSNTYRQQHYNRYTAEPQISVSQANLNQKNDSQGFLASLGTLGRKKRQQEGKKVFLPGKSKTMQQTQTFSNLNPYLYIPQSLN